MYLYIIFFILALLCIVELNFGRKYSKKILIIPIVVFFTLSFLRWERGSDWQAYHDMFINIFKIKYYQDNYEFLFVSLNKIVRFFTDSYTVFLFTAACIIFPCTYNIIKKYSISPILSLLVLFCTALGFIFFVRQTVAISLCLFAIHFIIQRKFLYFFVTVLAAFMFHRSAIVFLPAYFVYNLTFSRKQIILIVVCSFGLTFVAKALFGYLSLANIASISERSDMYLKEGKNSFGSAFSPMETMVRGIGYRLVVIIIGLSFYDLYVKDKMYRGFFNIYLVGVILFIIMVPISVALIRFAAYYEIAQLFLYPYIILFFKNKEVKNVVLFIMIAFFFIRINSVITGYYDLYIPYKSIFNKSLPVKF